MHTYRPDNPFPLCNIEILFDLASGRRRRSDANEFFGGRLKQDKVVKRVYTLGCKKIVAMGDARAKAFLP